MMVEKIVLDFDLYLKDNINLISIIDDFKCMHIEYERIKREFIKLNSETMFMLSKSAKHQFDVLSFDKYCKHLEELGL